MAKGKNKIRDLQFWYPNIPRKLVMAKGLSIQAKFIYMYMSCQSETFDFYLEPMAKEMNIGTRTLTKYIDELVGAGWITKGGQKFKNGRLGAVDYIVETSPKKKNTDVQKTAYSNTDVSNCADKYINSSINTPLNEDNSTMNSPVINKEEKRLSNDNQKKGVSSSRFVKPKIEQVEAYIKEKGYHFDAEHFWNYYESKGWKVGNSPMKNWKAACATWESKRKSENPDKSDGTTDLPAGLTPEQWKQARKWFKNRVPRIADDISPNDHLSMMALARWKRDVYVDILKEIEASDYTGSILEEFERISETEEYSQRLWGNE